MMKSGRILLASTLLCGTVLPVSAMTHSRRGPTSPKLFSKKAVKPSRAVKATGQRAIDDERATAIQMALIKQGYLSGEASGHWDASTEAAMQKMQSDNGWQTKLVPDSRAIIKLGLGASNGGETASAWNSVELQ